MAWFWMALTAAALYGVCYASMEHLLKHFPGSTIMAASYMTGAIVWGGYMLWTHNSGNLVKLATSSQHAPYMAAYIITAMTASYLVYQATAIKGATLPAIVEISYPLFTALAVTLMLGGLQITTGMMLGSVLIMSGVACVYMWG